MSDLQVIVTGNETEHILENAEVYKGIFWFRDIQTSEMICVKIPCNVDGSIRMLNSMPLNSKHGDNYNHEKTWNGFAGDIKKGKPYDYFPRGRVEISRGKVKIYLNPHLMDESIIDTIKKEFCLSVERGVKCIQVIPDYSDHYRCYLDT